MKITRINPVSLGSIKAFFDLETEEGFTLKGFKIVEGSNGMFVSFPSQKNKDGEYNDTVWASKELKAELAILAIHSFESYVPESLVVEENNETGQGLPF